MKPRSLSAIAAMTGGRLAGEDVTVTSVAADSREVADGDLFVALPGDRTDGHDHVAAAFQAGAGGAMVARSGPWPGPTVVVPDTNRALLDLGRAYRRELGARVVGVTGSSGKTSVKDLATAVLGTRYRVTASPRSFNTEVGVPITLLAADDATEVVVCEMGSRGPGHIRLLCDVARPDVGIVTNVGVAHMEMFGSAEAVAEAKAELVEALPDDGVAVLNADDPVVRGFEGRTRARAVLFGMTGDAQVRGEDLVLDEMGRPSFTLHTPDGAERVELPVTGEHMAWNALAAAACGTALGLTAGECAAGLKEARVSAWRMETFSTGDGVTVVNDAYNANPASVAAALKAARWIAADRRCLAVLGEMAELGAISRREHERVGELAARMGIEGLIAVGPGARGITAGALREGVEPDAVVTAASVDEALEALRSILRQGDVVLVKGSRVAGLERLAEALR
jgi:UDP-N-acetylmuramoyl-tripeptide--D-alanyl-D-alanine ligase